MIHCTTTSLDNLNIHLLRIWIVRYLPNLALLPKPTRSHLESRISTIKSVDSRKSTQAKVLKNLQIDCEASVLEAQEMIIETEILADVSEAEKTASQVAAIYQYLMNAYVNNFIFLPILDYLHTIETDKSKQSASLKILPKFNCLMNGLEPLVHGLRVILIESKNPRAIGYLTTQLHLSRQKILSRLDAHERLWLTPYIQLTEELICMPWPRVCAAANHYSPQTQTVTAIITKVIPRTELIAANVYQKMQQTYPNHVSRRGRIQSSGVEASSLRDLNMFQTYIWLALLEDNLSVIKNELLPLCLIVFPCSKVDWTLVQKSLQWLGEEISTHLTEQEAQIFSSYFRPIQVIFARNVNPEQIDVYALKQELIA